MVIIEQLTIAQIGEVVAVTMGNDLISAIEGFRRKLADCEISYEDLQGALRLLTTRFGREPGATELLRQVDEELRQQRQDCFDELYRDAQGMIERGEITNQPRLTEIVNALTRRAYPRNVQDEIRTLRALWQGRSQFDQLYQRVGYYIDQYQNAIRNKMNALEASKLHLDKAHSEIERFRRENRETPEVRALIIQVETIIKAADKTRIATQIQEKQYRDIIEDLQKREPDYIENLFNENNFLEDTAKRDVAIQWYRGQAEIWADRKADEYLAEGERYLNQGRVLAARDRARAVMGLFQVSFERKKKATDFLNERVEPLVLRIERARQALQQIPVTSKLDEALNLFLAALHPDSGYPDFRSVAEQERLSAGENGDVVRDVFAEARAYLIKSTGDAISSTLAYLDAQPPIWLPHVLDETAFEKLDRYLEFEQGYHKPQFNVRAAQLRAAWRNQNNRLEVFRTDVERANLALQDDNIAEAYALLVVYVDLLDDFAGVLPEGTALWQRIAALRERGAIYDQMGVRLNEGIRRNERYRDQIDDLNVLLEKAEIARQARVAGLSDEMWMRRIRMIRDLGHALEAEIFYDEKRLEDAITVLRLIAPESERIYQNAQTRILDLDKRLKNDNALDAAVQDAIAFLKQDDARSAWGILIKQRDKTDARGYEHFKSQLELARNRLRAQIVERIEDNILRAASIDNPNELVALTEQLREVDPQAYTALEQRIDSAVRLQTAQRDLKIAQEGMIVARWRDAWRSYQRVDNPDKILLLRIHERFVEVSVRDGINRIEQEPDTASALSYLDHVMRDVDDLRIQSDGETVITRRLRFMLMVRQAELGLTPSEVRTQCAAAATEYQFLLALGSHPDDVQQNIDETKNRLMRMERLASLFESVQSELKPTSDLISWHNMFTRWRREIAAYPRHIRLLDVMVNHLTQLSEALDIQVQNATVTWERIDPTARLVVLGRSSEDTLDYWTNALKSAINAAQLPDMIEVKPFAGQIVHVQHLKSAAIALFYLREHEPLPPDFKPEEIQAQTREGVNVRELLVALYHHLDDLAKVTRHIQLIRDRLNTARSTGDYNLVKRALDEFSIATSGYAQFSRHPDVLTIRQEADRIELIHGRYKKLAVSVRDAYAGERYEEVLRLLKDVETDEAREFGASQLVSAYDALSGQTLNNAVQVREAAARSQSELDDMYLIISELVKADSLIRFLRDQDVLEPIVTGVTLIDIGQVDSQVSALLETADYQKIRVLIRAVESGSVETLTTLNLRGMSLSDAQRIIANFRAGYARDALHSRLAQKVYDWVLGIFTQINVGIGRIRVLISRTDEFEALFKQAQQDFNAAYERAQQPWFRGKNADNNLCQLQIAYLKIVSGYPAGIPAIAARYTGLDGIYSQYKREIDRLNCNQATNQGAP